jgi:hypothetical protein
LCIDNRPQAAISRAFTDRVRSAGMIEEEAKKSGTRLGFSREQRVHVDITQQRSHTMHSTTPNMDREAALRWLIANRRPDISLEQALRTLRAALPRDEEAARLLQRISDEAASG